jgi:hypothetical protein
MQQIGEELGINPNMLNRRERNIEFGDRLADYA